MGIFYPFIANSLGIVIVVVIFIAVVVIFIAAVSIHYGFFFLSLLFEGNCIFIFIVILEIGGSIGFNIHFC